MYTNVISSTGNLDEQTIVSKKVGTWAYSIIIRNGKIGALLLWLDEKPVCPSRSASHAAVSRANGWVGGYTPGWDKIRSQMV